MAVPNWTTATLSAAETANRAADKPLLGVQMIPTSPTVERWNTEGTIAGGDHCDASYPARRAQDGFPHLVTKTDGSAGLGWFFVIDFGTAGCTFDFVALMGCNFATWLPSAAVTFELDNGNPNPGDTPDGTFTNIVTVASFAAPTTNDRLIDLDCHHTGAVPLRYSDVRYARLHFVNNATPYTPEIGELIVGRSYQLPYNPDRPFADYGLMDNAEISKSEGGVVQKISYYRRCFDLAYESTLTSTTERDDWLAFYRASGGAFLWVPQPTTAPNSFRLMMRTLDEAAMPRDVGQVRRVRLEATEQGPERFYLDQE